MAVGIAVGQANAILDALCRSVAYSDPASFNVKLHTGDPGVAGTSNAAGETTRKAATFGAAASGAITTTADLAWTKGTTSETYTHVSFWSDIAAGTFLGSDALDTSRAVTAGDNFTIVAGDLDVTITALAA
jgi:hypothetical protein